MRTVSVACLIVAIVSFAIPATGQPPVRLKPLPGSTNQARNPSSIRSARRSTTASTIFDGRSRYRASGNSTLSAHSFHTALRPLPCSHCSIAEFARTTR